MKESIELDTDPRARRRPAKGQKPAQVPLRPAIRTRERSGEDRAVRVTPVITRGPPTTAIALSPRSAPPPALRPHVATPVQFVPNAPLPPPPPAPFPAPAVAPGVVIATPSPVAQTVPPAAPIATLSPSAGGTIEVPFEPVQNAEDSITITPVASGPAKAKGAGVLFGVGGGAAVGFFGAGPVGAVIGGALGYLVTRKRT